MLGPLADNGGPTQTMALLSGSPAIDAGAAVRATGQLAERRDVMANSACGVCGLLALALMKFTEKTLPVVFLRTLVALEGKQGFKLFYRWFHCG